MKHPIVVGIAGGSGSGKSTYSRELAKRLGQRAVILAHDSYYRPLPDWLRDDPHAHNFDEPESLETDLMVQHVDELIAGHAIEVPIYDFATHDRQGYERVEPRPVILVEGILVLSEPALRKRFTHSVFVHAPEPVRLARRIRRDEEHRGRSMEDVLLQYFKTVRPSHEAWVEPSRDHATLLIDGTGPVEDGVIALMAIFDDR